MSQTEVLLSQAAEIAGRLLTEPSEAAVMEIFRRLAFEYDVIRDEREAGAALH